MSKLAVLSLLSAARAELAPPRGTPAVFEIATRPWLYGLAQSKVAAAKCGKSKEYVCLRDVPLAEWQKIADDSMDMVWLMGVWQLGDYGLQEARSQRMMDDYRQHALPDVTPEDVIGSPYSVMNYTVHSDIGTDADLAAVRKTLNGMGMRLMLDFIPNHNSVDSWLVENHPEIFVQRPSSGDYPADWWLQRGGKTFAFGRGPYDGPWTDTLNVNYWHPSAFKLMTDVVRGVAAMADAVRCDMGMLILNDVIERSWGGVMQAGGFNRPGEEFWQHAISAVKAEHPNTLFMAEAYDYYITSPPEKALLQRLGFDIVYDKAIVDRLHSGNLDSLKSYIGSQSQSYLAGTAHFVENHDEPRAALLLGGGQQGFVGSVVASTVPGLRLFYFGQFDGLKNRLAVQLRRAVPESADPALHTEYTKFLKVLADDVFHEGSWSFIDVSKDGSGWRMCAWRWALGSRKRLVVVNFSDAVAYQNVVVPDAEGSSGDGITITELLTGKSYQRSAGAMRSTGLGVLLQPWSAQIFSYDGGSAAAVLV